MSFTPPLYLKELKIWFSWYNCDDELEHEQFLYDYFTHFDLTH